MITIAIKIFKEVRIWFILFCFESQRIYLEIDLVIKITNSGL